MLPGANTSEHDDPRPVPQNASAQRFGRGWRRHQRTAELSLVVVQRRLRLVYVLLSNWSAGACWAAPACWFIVLLKTNEWRDGWRLYREEDSGRSPSLTRHARYGYDPNLYNDPIARLAHRRSDRFH